MGQPNQISAESGSFAVRPVTMYYNKEWKGYCKSQMQKHFLYQPEYTEARNLARKHSLLCLLGQFFKNDRTLPQTDQQKGENTLSSQEKSTEIFFCKLLYEVGSFAQEIFISLKNTSWLFAVQTVGTGLRLHLSLQKAETNPFLIKCRYKARPMLEDRGFCQTTLSFPLSSQ